MAIPNTSSITPSTAPLFSSPRTMEVGELKIGEQSYIVSIESSKPFTAGPKEDTIEKIRYLVNLHLDHLKLAGTDLSKIVIQQLDEKGLSYIKEDSEQKLLPSLELRFDPSDTNSSRPISLRNASISSILDIYRSIIDPLTKRAESQEEKTSTTTTKKSPNSTTFNFQPEESLENLDAKPGNAENHSATTRLNASPNKKDQLPESEDETTEPTATEDKTTGLLTGEPKENSSYNQSSIASRFYHLVSSIKKSLHNLGKKADSSNGPIVNTQKIMEEEESTFRSSLSESEKNNFNKFTTTNFR